MVLRGPRSPYIVVVIIANFVTFTVADSTKTEFHSFSIDKNQSSFESKVR